MKAVVAALLCCVGLASCGGAVATSPSPSPSGTTYASVAHHFAVTYDPAQFRATTRKVDHQQFLLSLRTPGGGEVDIDAITAGADYVQGQLAYWNKGTLGPKSFNPWMQELGDATTADWTTLNGAQGIKFDCREDSPPRVVSAYVLAGGSELYSIYEYAPAKDWTAAAPALQAVARTFRVVATPTASPKSMPTSPAPAPSVNAALPRSYTNPTLGLSFDYPAGWRLSVQPLGKQAADIVVATDDGKVVVALHAIALLSRPYADANQSEVAQQLALMETFTPPGFRLLHSGLATLDGLRLAEVEYRRLVRLHCLELYSGIRAEVQPASALTITVACPVGRWPAESPTLMAILDSLRISKPTG